MSLNNLLFVLTIHQMNPLPTQFFNLHNLKILMYFHTFLFINSDLRRYFEEGVLLLLGKKGNEAPIFLTLHFYIIFILFNNQLLNRTLIPFKYNVY